MYVPVRDLKTYGTQGRGEVTLVGGRKRFQWPAPSPQALQCRQEINRPPQYLIRLAGQCEIWEMFDHQLLYCSLVWSPKSIDEASYGIQCSNLYIFSNSLNRWHFPTFSGWNPMERMKCFFSEVNCRGRFNTIASILPSHYRKIGEEKILKDIWNSELNTTTAGLQPKHPSCQ